MVTAPTPVREVRQGDWIEHPGWSGQVIRVREGRINPTKVLRFITVSINSQGVTRWFEDTQTLNVVLED